jgi:5-methylcytosine-specific restriction protein A
MAWKHWTDNDLGYEGWLSANPQGFMANTNYRPNSRYFKIHRAKHNLPDRSNSGSVNPRTGNEYSKVTADSLDDLIDYARTLGLNELGNSNYCKTCGPRG